MNSLSVIKLCLRYQWMFWNVFSSPTSQCLWYAVSLTDRPFLGGSWANLTRGGGHGKKNRASVFYYPGFTLKKIVAQGIAPPPKKKKLNTRWREKNHGDGTTIFDETGPTKRDFIPFPNFLQKWREVGRCTAQVCQGPGTENFGQTRQSGPNILVCEISESLARRYASWVSRDWRVSDSRDF